MKLKHLLVVLFTTLVFSAAASPSREMERAVKLYDSGMYDRARSVFESLPQTPLSDGYVVLCAIRRARRTMRS